MSAYGPGSSQLYTKPVPPQKGSFPLDHDGECKHVMVSYLSCMRRVKGVNEDECRDLAKAYLSCRMDHNLMARDDFKNLGFQTPEEPTAGKSASEGSRAAQAGTQQAAKPKP